VTNAELKSSRSYALESRAHGGTGIAGYRREQLRYPAIEDLRRRARQRVPKFAFDYFDSGSGENLVMRRNREALDDIQFLPRYGLGRLQVSSRVELFGRPYHAPIGISPVGLGGLLWPKMEQYLARSAQRATAPYILSTAASASIEQIAGIAPDAFWFQIYDLPRDDHRWTFDLIARADTAGAHVLVATIDTPVRAKRPQDMRNRLTVPFRPRLSTVIDVARHPRWFWELLRRGTPCCESLRPYAGNNASARELTHFATNEIKGGFTWEMIQRIRQAWPRAFVIKGLAHPADVEKALSLGVDGFIVSNHGGRTFDGVPASVDLLPTVRAVSGDATLILDSGIRTGLDVVRGIAVGADAVITARPFLYAVAALGANGGDHAFDLLLDETQMAMGQIGVQALDQLAGAEVIHRGALKPEMRSSLRR
jgi:(S)-mandelate dehydrogenase